MPRGNAPIQIRLDAETKQRWQEAADASGLSLSEFCRKAVEQKVSVGPADVPVVVRLPAAQIAASLAEGGKRSYKPDPKQGPKEKR